MFTNSWFEKFEHPLENDVLANQGRIFRSKPEFDAGINLRSERPFSGFGNEQILDSLRCSLRRDWTAFELSTLLMNEAEYRNDRLKRKINDLITEENFKPIPWLIKARDCIRSESTEFMTGGATSSNYFVLLIRDGEYECYVGQTATNNLLGRNSRQEARIIQHFCNIRASNHVKKHGHEPLWSLNCFTEKVLYGRRIEAETKYNLSLTDLEIRVRGDRQTQDSESQN
jgi:hypothetical protein